MNVRRRLFDLTLKNANRGHRAMLRVSGGRVGATAADLPVVKLTTTGRRSGQPRTVMLVTPVRRGDAFVLVASKGGDDRHPDWYRNLQADPEVAVEPVGAARAIRCVARSADGDERAALWAEIVEKSPGYGDYQAKTTREIPVVICEPLG